MNTPLPRIHLSSLSRTANHFADWRDHDHFDLNAPYQRGSVWTVDQQRNLIKSLLMGLPIGSIITSDLPFQAGNPYSYRVVDGKQRIEAIRAFIDGTLAVPSEWFGDDDRTVPAGQTVTHADLTRSGQARIEEATVSELVFAAEFDRSENPDFDPAATDKWHKPVPGSDPKTHDRYLVRRRTDAEILQAEAELFLLINFGGVSQTADDRARAQEIADR